INKLLESAVTISQNEWKQVANLELELEQELPSVTAFPGALGQAFLNLIVNAAQAMGKSIADEQARGALRISSQRDKDWVFVQIEDSGPGISPEIIDKIFDPFFTTKDVDQGSGQGLALVHSTIVDQHAGSVSVASKVDHGSIFKVGIPING
ncbi:MAG: hypothetical protein KDD62_07110, partial [Bdellovibrionales bacterium]|nr:hypothetical protein [Bdellovibrionales bacterium]